MTPRPLRERLLSQCDFRPGMRVLDPGVGTGEFLASVLDRQPDAQVHGWDVDPTVLSVARAVVPDARLEHRSALDPWSGPPFDLVVGNPPYFQFRASPAIRAQFREVISGRVNIFALFFQRGLQLLRPGGQLAYVVPPSMNNGAYFNNLRSFLTRHADVEFLEVHCPHDLFHGAQTSVQIIVARLGRGSHSGRHVVTFHEPHSGFERTVFSSDADALVRYRDSGRTLFELGYEAVTGTIVWNQHRDALRRHANGSTVHLIWSHNIGDDLRLTHDHRRPQFIETMRTNRGPAIVVNRITGSVGHTTLRCAAIPEAMPFVAENHVNVIRRHGHFSPKCDWVELLHSLKSPTVGEHARLLTGNTQISAKELTYLVRI